MSIYNRIKVLVLCDDPLACLGLSATIARYKDLELVDDEAIARAMDPHQVVRQAAPDVVVADYDHGIELANRSRRAGASTSPKVMIVASRAGEWEVRKALECGVRGYLLAGCALDELASAVRTVQKGLRHLDPRVAERLAESLSGEPLTSREEQVLHLVVDGLSNKEIARQLNVAVGTVKSHLKGIFDKLSVQSRTQAILNAQSRGLLRSRPKSHRSEVGQTHDSLGHAQSVKGSQERGFSVGGGLRPS